jgi:predicted amidohydrolase
VRPRQDGTVRVLLAASQCDKGDVAGNLGKHLRILGEAAAGGCELAVFPEMSLTGSVDPAVHPEHLIGLDDPAVTALATATGTATGASDVAVCFGVAESTPDGPCITQVVAAAGRVLGVQRKRHLGEGEESFVPATASEVFELAGVRFAVAICAESGFDGPFDAAASDGARLVLFPAAPGLYGRRTDDASWQAGLSWWESCGLEDARRQASRLGLWIAAAGQSGSTVDEDFPGLAALVDPSGRVVVRLPDWREATLTVEIPL